MILDDAISTSIDHIVVKVSVEALWSQLFVSKHLANEKLKLS